MNKIVSNKEISDRMRRRIEQALADNEEALIAVVGDILLDSTFGESALVFTEDRLFCVEESGNPDSGFFVSLKDVEFAEVSRNYGIASLIINGETVMKFSFGVVGMMESICDQLNLIKSGETNEEVISGIIEAIEKTHCICKNCGAPLIRPGAECVHCLGKGKILKKLWGYIAPEKWVLILCLIMSGVATSSLLVPPYITKTLVDDVLPNSDIKKLFMLVGLLLFLYLLQCVLGSVRGYLMDNAGNRIVTHLRNDVYKKTQYLPISFFDKTSTGSITSRISGDTNTINNFMMTITQEAIVQFLTMIGIIIIMLALNWKLTILSLTPIPIIVIGSKWFSKKVRPIYHRIWMRSSAVNSMLCDSIPGIRIIKSFTGEERTISKFEDINDKLYKERKNASALNTVFPHVITMLVSMGSLIIWGFGGELVIGGNSNMSVGLLVSFISYAAQFYVPVRFFANISDKYQQALTSIERVLDIIDADTERDFGKGNNIEKIEGKIEFKNVNFSFDRTKKTLDNINLTIEPGDIVGVVGTTGSGKSTMINLLMRFYDNYDGEIYVDGKNIKNIDLKSYRDQIGFVQQEPTMFNDTVYNNIAFSDPEASVEQVIESADIANAHSFISRMPDGYDAMLGERGIGLSGGEKQRLSIARAVLKNPSLLIFDEATASVDSETEHLIQEAIERLVSGRTTIMIAHRLSTLRKANKIVVVDKGRIIECGTPDELMEKKGKYYRLVEIQGMAEMLQKKSTKERVKV